MTVFSGNVAALEERDKEIIKEYPDEIYETLFAEAGILVPEKATFGLTELEIGDTNDTVEVAYMLTRAHDVIDYSVLLTFRENSNRISDVVDFREVVKERLAKDKGTRSSGSVNGTYCNVTATVSSYYYIKSGASTYLYRPRQLSYVSTRSQIVEASYYIGGALYNGQSQDLKDEDSYEIHMPSRTTTIGTTYSKQATTSYYYQVHQGHGGLGGHQLTLIIAGDVYTKPLVNGYNPY